METVHLPVDYFNEQVKKLHRSTGDAEMSIAGWRGEEFYIRLTWPDGEHAEVSVGPVAAALIEQFEARVKGQIH